MSGNRFDLKRFLMLFKQHHVHNNKLLVYATVAYIGVIFIILTIVPIGNDRTPNNLDRFDDFLLGFVSIFGILYAGHSFPAFRGKVSSINYLMLPASVLEKFLFELFSRLSIVFILLPLLFWITYNFQGYFFNMFTALEFQAIGFGQLLDFELFKKIGAQDFWFFTLIFSLVILSFVLPFTGGAIYNKQPLVKTLFSVTIIVIFYAGCLNLIIETLGVEMYELNDTMWLIPHDYKGALRFLGSVAVISNLVMLFVAYRKLKEKEV